MCFVWCLNNPDPVLVLPLFVICVLALVAGALITGKGGQVGSVVPELRANPLLVRCADGHRGGGISVRNKRRAQIRQLGRSLTSSTSMERLRRPLMALSFRGLSESGRWAFPSVSSANPLAEGQSYGARASAPTLARFLPPGIDTISEAVLHRPGVRLFLLLLQEMMRRRSAGPKWFVPGDVRIESELWQQFGPDCNLSSPSRVLFANSRDWSVFYFLSSPFLRFVLLLVFF